MQWLCLNLCFAKLSNCCLFVICICTDSKGRNIVITTLILHSHDILCISIVSQPKLISHHTSNKGIKQTKKSVKLWKEPTNGKNIVGMCMLFFLSYSVFITVAILKIIFQSLTQYNELKPS